MPHPRLQRHSSNERPRIADAGRLVVHMPPVLDAYEEQRDAMAIERWPEGEFIIDEWQALDDEAYFRVWCMGIRNNKIVRIVKTR